MLTHLPVIHTILKGGETVKTFKQRYEELLAQYLAAGELLHNAMHHAVVTIASEVKKNGDYPTWS